MVTVTVVAPAAMVALAGPVTPLLVELNATVKPPVGAGEEMVIVPVVLVPAKTVVGLRVNPVTVGPFTVRFAVADELLAVPVIVAVVLVATAVVVIENVAVVAPPATVTVAGTVAADELELRSITSPADGAALEIVTVPVELAPPTSEVGFRVTDDTVGPLTFNAPVAVVRLIVALISPVTLCPTASVVAVKLTLLDPAGTVTDPGTVTHATGEARVTLMPPDGAFPVRVTVPVEDAPPSTVDGLNVTVDGTGGTTVRSCEALPPPPLAETVASRVLDTGWAVTVNVAVLDPEFTFTEPGTVTADWFDERVTVTPAAGAAAVRVTVPVIVAPPYAGFGEMEREVTLCPQPRHGTTKASNNKRNLIGGFKTRLRFLIRSSRGIDAPSKKR